jgi:hypothetical protein
LYRRFSLFSVFRCETAPPDAAALSQPRIAANQKNGTGIDNKKGHGFSLIATDTDPCKSVQIRVPFLFSREFYSADGWLSARSFSISSRVRFVALTIFSMDIPISMSVKRL